VSEHTASQFPSTTPFPTSRQRSHTSALPAPRSARLPSSLPQLWPRWRISAPSTLRAALFSPTHPRPLPLHSTRTNPPPSGPLVASRCGKAAGLASPFRLTLPAAAYQPHRLPTQASTRCLAGPCGPQSFLPLPLSLSLSLHPPLPFPSRCASAYAMRAFRLRHKGCTSLSVHPTPPSPFPTPLLLSPQVRLRMRDARLPPPSQGLHQAGRPVSG
jgi:hypothetical protein